MIWSEVKKPRDRTGQRAVERHICTQRLRWVGRVELSGPANRLQAIRSELGS